MKIKLKRDPELWDEKIVTKFLWFPVFTYREMRWLETATIKYTYRPVSRSSNGWSAEYFIDNDVI